MPKLRLELEPPVEMVRAARLAIQLDAPASNTVGDILKNLLIADHREKRTFRGCCSSGSRLGHGCRLVLILLGLGLRQEYPYHRRSHGRDAADDQEADPTTERVEN